MREILIKKIIEVCDKKIAAKGENVGLSFYAFFANKNDDPELLLEAATWWIMTHKLDHFEKAIKIKSMLQWWKLACGNLWNEWKRLHLAKMGRSHNITLDGLSL